MSVPTPRQLLTREIANAICLALAFWGCFSALAASNQETSFAQLANAGRHFDCLVPVQVEDADARDVSAASQVRVPVPESSQAELGQAGELPSAAAIVTQCIMATDVHCWRFSCVITPDHLIELPGTPPPRLA